MGSLKLQWNSKFKMDLEVEMSKFFLIFVVKLVHQRVHIILLEFGLPVSPFEIILEI